MKISHYYMECHGIIGNCDLCVCLYLFVGEEQSSKKSGSSFIVKRNGKTEMRYVFDISWHARNYQGTRLYKAVLYKYCSYIHPLWSSYST